MSRKMFGHALRKRSAMNIDEDEIPGGTATANPVGYSSNYKATDNPPNYEGKEHVKYKNPGYTRHNIRYPEDEPHMKSHVSQDEEHEMEDNYHMGVPDQTEDTLEAKIKRAHMKMDQPDQEDPDELMGNIVHNVGVQGEEDTSGEEMYGPNHMQSGGHKERRKKMIVSVMKKKMKKMHE